MIIDKQQLTELLMGKTGLDKDQVEGQLSELIKRIQTATADGKSFEIEDFGSFSIEDEELQFNPVDRLETEINNKYAGMKPIELIGAFKEPDGSEIPEMPEETADQDGVWAFDETAEQEKQKEQDAGQSEEEVPSEVEELIEPTASDEKAQEEFEELINQDEDKSGSKKAIESLIATDDSDEQPKSPAEPNTDKKDTSEEEDPLGRVLVAVVVVLIIGISGFFIYDTGILADDTSSSDPTVAVNESVEQAEMGGDQNEPDQEASVIDSEPEESEEVLTPAADVEEEKQSDDEQEETYGLRGDFNSSVNGYTIVVHSLRSQEQAATRRQNLEEEGFRTLINEANVQGTMYYRVGIGQFATIKAAQDAIDAVPERYKNDHFIKRIQ